MQDKEDLWLKEHLHVYLYLPPPETLNGARISYQLDSRHVFFNDRQNIGSSTHCALIVCSNLI